MTADLAVDVLLPTPARTARASPSHSQPGTPFSLVVTSATQPADSAVVTLPPTPPTATATATAEESAVADPASRLGLAPGSFDQAWTVSDVQGYLRIGRTHVYALLNSADAPPRLRTGRSHRWNGAQVVAWLHGEDWKTLDQPRDDHHADGCPIGSTAAPGSASPPPRSPDLAAAARAEVDAGVETGAGGRGVRLRSVSDGVDLQTGGRRATRAEPTTESGGAPVVRVVDPDAVHRAHASERVAQIVRRV